MTSAECFRSFDAMVWAKYFDECIKINPTIASDPGTMLSWFASALMRGYDEARRRDKPSLPPEKLAEQFHNYYEKLAPDFGYKTREASAKPWAEVPDQNKRLMIAVCEQVLNDLLYPPEV